MISTLREHPSCLSYLQSPVFEGKPATRATPERIWTILVDLAAHSQWNPFVKRIEGDLKTGSTLRITVQPQGGKGMTFRSALLAVVPNRELRWQGRFLVPGLFDGEHYFMIERIGADTCRFVHGEVFSGLLVSLFRSSLDAGTKGRFVAMNRALKERAERSPSHRDE